MIEIISSKLVALGVYINMPLLGVVYCHVIIDIYAPEQFLVGRWKLSMIAFLDNHCIYFFSNLDFVIDIDSVHISTIHLHIIYLPFSIIPILYHQYYVL